MSNYSRKLRRRGKADRDARDHATALQDIKRWERGLIQHWLVTVRRLMMAGHEQAPAELAAYRAIVKGLSGRESEIGPDDMPREFQPVVKLGSLELEQADGDDATRGAH